MGQLEAIDMAVGCPKGGRKLLPGHHGHRFRLRTRTPEPVSLGPCGKGRAPDHAALVAVLHYPAGQGYNGLFL